MNHSKVIIYALLIFTAILVLIGWYLVKKEKCVIFYGREDQINSFFAFVLPVFVFFITFFILIFLGIDDPIHIWISSGVSALVLLYGLYKLIRSAITHNTNSKLYVPFVIFMKIYIGLWVGIAFAVSIISWNQNLRDHSRDTANTIRLMRFASLFFGGIFLLIANMLTTFPEGERPFGINVLKKRYH